VKHTINEGGHISNDLASEMYLGKGASVLSRTGGIDRLIGSGDLDDALIDGDNDIKSGLFGDDLGPVDIFGDEICSLINEEEMLDIAEQTFIRIGEGLVKNNQTVKALWNDYIFKEDVEPNETIDLISPNDFLNGLKKLKIEEVTQKEIACIMRVLTKPALRNSIVLHELSIIMENFGIFEDGEKSGNHENALDKCRRQKKQLDLSGISEETLNILARLAYKLRTQIISIYDYFKGSVYEQLVRTKKRQNVVELITSENFILRLQQDGFLKITPKKLALSKIDSEDATQNEQGSMGQSSN
jgi:hypothetical protein